MDSAKAKTGLPRELAINGETYTLVPVKIPVQVNYDPIPGVPEEPERVPDGEPFYSFVKSPQFWMIGIASCASILIRDDFQTLPWNQIVGQILTLWGGGASSFGLLNKVSKNLSAK